MLTTALASAVVGGAEVASLLERPTWSFSSEEAVILNDIQDDETRNSIASVVARATNTPTAGQLLDSRFIDLDRDGIFELVARVDVSGRRVSMDFHIISRQQGEYLTCLVPGQGTTIAVRELEGTTRVIGYQQPFQLSRADEAFDFPVLYRWSGRDCAKDTSAAARGFYAAEFVPLVHAAVQELAATELTDRAESHDPAVQRDSRSAISRAIALGMAIATIDDLFAMPVFPAEDSSVLLYLLDTLDSDWIVEADDAQRERIREALDQARASLRQ